MSPSKKIKPAGQIEPEPNTDAVIAAPVVSAAERTRSRRKSRKDPGTGTRDNNDHKRLRRKQRREKRGPQREVAVTDRIDNAASSAPADTQVGAEKSTRKGKEQKRSPKEHENEKGERKKRRKHAIKEERQAPRTARRRAGADRESDADSKEDALLDDALDLPEEDETDDESSARPQRPGDLLVGAVATRVFAGDSAVAARLFERLKAEFADAEVQLTPAVSEPRLIVALGETGAARAAEFERSVRVLLKDLVPGRESEERIASQSRDILLPVAGLLRRFANGKLLDSSGIPTVTGLDTFAVAARDAVLIAQGIVLAHAAEREIVPPDLEQAQSLAENPSNLLNILSWRSPLPPKSIQAVASSHSIEAFLDNGIGYRAKGKNHVMPFPFDWSEAPANRNIAYAAHGLDFAAGILTYWVHKAGKSGSKRIAKIDELVKQKNVTASMILNRAGQVILDIVDRSSGLPKEAWQLNVVMRRARAMVLYLLCCRLAAQQKIKFDETACGPVLQSLVEMLDILRWAGQSRLGTARAVAYAVNVAGLALPLRKTSFGSNLLKDALEAIQRHLAFGLSDDGVWRESFSGHNAVFRVLRSLSGDLRSAGEPSGEFTSAITEMARFTAAYLRDDGYPPPLAGVLPKKYWSSRTAAQRLLQGRGSKRKKSKPAAEDASSNSCAFPQAGYFASRSPAKKSGGGTSHLVLWAAPARLGGPSLTFTCGSSLILIGGGTNDRKAPVEIRRANLWDPGAHNAVRVDGQKHNRKKIDDALSVKIERSWEGKNWSAVKLINRHFAPATIVRTLIHLKPLNAFIVVDELHAGGEARKFQQFWHLAPGLKPQQRHAHQFRFSVEDPDVGGVIAAFDEGAPAVPKSGGTEPIGWTSGKRGEVFRNLYFVREIQAEDAVIATLFRCTASAAKHEISVERMPDGWRAALVCEGRQILFASEGEQLKLVG